MVIKNNTIFNRKILDFSIDNVSGEMYVSVGQDSQLKVWSLPQICVDDLSEPIHSVPLQGVAHSVSHIANSLDFVTSGEGISVWKINRYKIPIKSFKKILEIHHFATTI